MVTVRCHASKDFERCCGRRSTQRAARCNGIRNGVQARTRMQGRLMTSDWLAECIGAMQDGHRRCIRLSVNRSLHRVDRRDRHATRLDIAASEPAQILAVMRGHHLHADRYAVMAPRFPSESAAPHSLTAHPASRAPQPR